MLIFDTLVLKISSLALSLLIFISANSCKCTESCSPKPVQLSGADCILKKNMRFKN